MASGVPYTGARGVTLSRDQRQVGYTGTENVGRGGYKTPGGQVVKPTAPTAGLPSISGGAKATPATSGGPAVTGTTIARPSLSPLNPQADYDPKIAEALGRQRAYTDDLKKGAGFAMDVLGGAQADQMESQIAQARAAAAQAGIPFDEEAMRAKLTRGLNAAMAEEKLGREQMVGGALAAEAGTAGTQAGERTSRLGIDLQRDIGENAQKLDLYGRDIQKYGTDVQKYGIDTQAAVAANNALMSFYTQLMGGMMNMASSAMRF